MRRCHRIGSDSGTPVAIVSGLSGVIAEVLKQPEVAKRLGDVGLEAVGDFPAIHLVDRLTFSPKKVSN